MLVIKRNRYGRVKKGAERKACSEVEWKRIIMRCRNVWKEGIVGKSRRRWKESLHLREMQNRGNGRWE